MLVETYNTQSNNQNHRSNPSYELTLYIRSWPKLGLKGHNQLESWIFDPRVQELVSSSSKYPIKGQERATN